MRCANLKGAVQAISPGKSEGKIQSVRIVPGALDGKVDGCEKVSEDVGLDRQCGIENRERGNQP
jgi:hypothetical protein